VSNYNDPRWYEEQKDGFNAPQQPAQPHDDFEHYPFLPGAEHTHIQQYDQRLALPDTKQSRVQHILRRVLLPAILVLLAFWGGWFSHQYFGETFNQSNQSQSYSQLVQEAWNKIDKYYVDRKAVDYRKMSYAAIDAMVQTLHDTGHSRFMDPKTVQTENQQLSGKFTGIGIYLHVDKDTKRLTITSPIPGSPAEKAGLKHGDVILAINGVDMKGKDINAASTLIQGNAGSSVTLSIQRPGNNTPITFKVTRAEIQVPNVLMHYIAESHIAHIQVMQFADGISSQIRDDVNKARGMGATKIILDLRDNPGGYLNEAVNTTSLFVKSGNVLLEQDSSGNRTPEPVNGNAIDTTSQMVVLVNENSASAAEIVSGSLQDNNRAIILGKKTFGTGTVLQQFTLADGSALYLGTQEWLTPKGHFIRSATPGSGGITPNIQVDQGATIATLSPNDENQANMTQQQILDSGDAQLAAAIQYLNGHK